MENLLVERLQADLQQLAAPWVASLGLRVVVASDEGATAVLPVSPALVHGGGVLCGQAMMAAADTLMVLATAAATGGMRPMTTVQLQTSFLRPVAADAGEVRVACRILRKGRSLVFGEVEICTPDGRLAAHATSTYALL